MRINRIIQQWFIKTVVDPKPSNDQIIEELKQEHRRVLQEMQLYAEGRGAENLPISESLKITLDLLIKSRESR